MLVVAIIVQLMVAQADTTAGLLIDRRLAEALPAAVGDTVRVRSVGGGRMSRAFVVSGIFERAADPSRISRNEYEVRFHLPDLESLLGTRDRVDRIAVALRSEADVGAMGRWVETLAYGTSVFETARVAEESSATFRVVSRFHEAIAVVTLLASGIFLLCLMVVRVDERRADVGTMRLMGISRRTVMRAVVGEAVVVALVASVFGAALGWVIAAGVNAYYAAYYDTTLRFAIVTPRIVGFSVALGLVLGIGAGVLAAGRVATVPVQRLGER